MRMFKEHLSHTKKTALYSPFSTALIDLRAVFGDYHNFSVVSKNFFGSLDQRLGGITRSGCAPMSVLSVWFEKSSFQLSGGFKFRLTNIATSSWYSSLSEFEVSSVSTLASGLDWNSISTASLSLCTKTSGIENTFVPKIRIKRITASLFILQCKNWCCWFSDDLDDSPMWILEKNIS